MALFFIRRKPRGFDYTPRYYDPDQEEREERKRIVLGEKYRSPEQKARESAGGSPREEYVPGAYLRERIAARRGSAHAVDAMKKRRRKALGIPVLIVILAVLVLVIRMLYM